MTVISVTLLDRMNRLMAQCLTKTASSNEFYPSSYGQCIVIQTKLILEKRIFGVNYGIVTIASRLLVALDHYGADNHLDWPAIDNVADCYGTGLLRFDSGHSMAYNSLKFRVHNEGNDDRFGLVGDNFGNRNSNDYYRPSG